jgi:hypothetical protein
MNEWFSHDRAVFVGKIAANLATLSLVLRAFVVSEVRAMHNLADLADDEAVFKDHKQTICDRSMTLFAGLKAGSVDLPLVRFAFKYAKDIFLRTCTLSFPDTPSVHAFAYLSVYLHVFANHARPFLAADGKRTAFIDAANEMLKKANVPPEHWFVHSNSGEKKVDDSELDDFVTMLSNVQRNEAAEQQFDARVESAKNSRKRKTNAAKSRTLADEQNRAEKRGTGRKRANTAAEAESKVAAARAAAAAAIALGQRGAGTGSTAEIAQ